MVYFLSQIFLGFRRSPVFCVLIVIIISMGIAASTSMLVVLRTLHANPLPGISDRLFHLQIEPSVVGRPSTRGKLPDSLTWDDAAALLRATPGKRKASILGAQLTFVPTEGVGHARWVKSTLTQSAFFPMFRAQFADGGAWTAVDDDQASRVVVISDVLSRSLFGSTKTTGRIIRFGDFDFRVVGVLKHWAPKPRFYALSEGAFAPPEDVFMPLSTARDIRAALSVSPDCWGSGFPDLERPAKAPCSWVPFWVELDVAGDAPGYLRFLSGYVKEQQALGRFQRESVVQLHNVMEWIEEKNVVPSAARLQAFIAYGFLFICIGNASGLLFIMFLGRRRELGLRRALGATQRQIFRHLVAETAGIGLMSCAGGIALTIAAMALLRQRPEAHYAAIEFDPAVVCIGVALTLVATAVATCVPAWHVARSHPYRMLNS
ncbi:putative ABC transport system permease protein [Luteibacter sp. Sphag1AF]|uniref:ABC transporter permease n=1 Tax=Luteibacter sp. Sphag1AF TaxID=2587031 RepID=UPI00160D1049|nr:ABC transporter permease [Luteibacter sp. Sphag1AF]MBB3226072.1 putative ABC transport system permease protein [Luteibacter sp. Sphag1AF]